MRPDGSTKWDARRPAGSPLPSEPRNTTASSTLSTERSIQPRAMSASFVRRSIDSEYLGKSTTISVSSGVPFVVYWTPASGGSTSTTTTTLASSAECSVVTATQQSDSSATT